MVRMILTLGFAMLALEAAHADEVSDGRALAEQWCAGCHLVSPEQTVGGDGAPAFATIAADTTKSDAALAAWISDPHPPMPNPGLSRDQIDAVIAYLRSIRH